MAPTAIFDVDGTLVDSNYQHTLAWFRAFRRHDITLPLWRIHRAIGMGGDQLVAALAGEEVERKHGDALRDAWTAEFAPMLDEVCPLHGVVELLEAVRERGLPLVLASSGKSEHVDHYLDLIDGRRLADAWTSSDDVERTKPAPDLVAVARKRGGGGDAVMIGDSTWDIVAANKLDIPTIAVHTGGFAVDELREAGAVAVYDSLDELREDLDNTPLGG